MIIRKNIIFNIILLSLVLLKIDNGFTNGLGINNTLSTMCTNHQPSQNDQVKHNDDDIESPIQSISQKDRIGMWLQFGMGRVSGRIDGQNSPDLNGNMMFAVHGAADYFVNTFGVEGIGNGYGNSEIVTGYWTVGYDRYNSFLDYSINGGISYSSINTKNNKNSDFNKKIKSIGLIVKFNSVIFVNDLFGIGIELSTNLSPNVTCYSASTIITFGVISDILIESKN